MAFGLGWRLRLGGGVVHGGGGPGVKSQLYTYPEKNVAVAILTNSAHGDLVAKDIMRPLLEGMGSPALDRKELDIVKYILDLCKTDAELQRVGSVLLLYQEAELFDLLRFMKYFVDTCNKHNVVLGVGRGSSVASYVLYLLGAHQVNSMFYDLDFAEFLR